MQEVGSEKVSVRKASRLAGDDGDDNSDGVKDDYDDNYDDDDDDDDLPRLASSSDTRGVAARLLGGIGLSSILIVMTRMKMMMMALKMMMTLAMTMITPAMSSSFHTWTASCPSCHCPRR